MSLRIPPDPRLARSVRLAMGGVASLAGFDVDAIEDLRVAVNELLATLIERGDGSDVEVRITVTSNGSLCVEGSTPLGSPGDSPERFRLSEQILEMLVDRHGFSTGGDVAMAWMERDRPVQGSNPAGDDESA